MPASAAPGRLAVAVVLRAQPFLRVAASRALVGRCRSRTDPTIGRFTRGEVAGFVRAAIHGFEARVPDLPAEPTTGSRQNVMLAALTLAMLQMPVAALAYQRALEVGPTRPHPHAPHAAVLVTLAYHLNAARDHVLDTLDSRPVPPTAPRRGEVRADRWRSRVVAAQRTPIDSPNLDAPSTSHR